MNKQELYDFLKNKNIAFEITDHPAVYNMADVADIEIPYPDGDAKNIFVRDDKKRNYYLITLKADKRVNLKEFKEQNKTRSLSFASPDDLMSIMGLTPGTVTPFGLLNDKDSIVHFFIDNELVGESKHIGVHPNDNTATIWLKTDDLLNIIGEHGNDIHIVNI